VLGGAVAAISGAVLVQFVGAWAPASWGYGETFFFFTALIIGGVGSNSGSLLGAVIVFGVVINGIQFLPNFSYSNLTVALQSIALGVAFIVFIWLKPSGLLPERPDRFGELRRTQVVPTEREGVAA
jgi:branched-chain amino acid transport system permease protein